MLEWIIWVFSYVADNSFLFGLMCLSFYYLLNRLRTTKLDNNLETGSTNFERSHCGNVACVRCRLYADVIHESRIRLKKNLRLYKDNKTIHGISEKLLSSLDITEALDKVKTKDGTAQYPNVLFYTGLVSKPWWKTEDVLNSRIHKDVSPLGDSFAVILNEFEQLMIQPEIGFWKRNRTESGSWDVFPIMNQGCWIDDNVELCPKTARIVSGLDGLLSGNVFGNVMFSVLQPGTVIEPHYGPTNIRLRCHLGLVTEPECKLTVAGESKEWQTGVCVVFDDSFLHSVNHFGDQDRVVLIVDLLHPDVGKEEREIINQAFKSD